MCVLTGVWKRWKQGCRVSNGTNGNAITVAGHSDMPHPPQPIPSLSHSLHSFDHSVIPRARGRGTEVATPRATAPNIKGDRRAEASDRRKRAAREGRVSDQRERTRRLGRIEAFRRAPGTVPCPGHAGFQIDVR
jgi:hypothetical protein